jgi:hypothetical protein
MNNNAILPCFQQEQITILSILGNFTGFFVNVFGFLLLVFAGGIIPNFWDISTENWWVLKKLK